jgi:competence protein ComGC
MRSRPRFSWRSHDRHCLDRHCLELVRASLSAPVRFNRRKTKLRPRVPSYARGFTILEVTIMAAIIGLLAAIAVPSFLHARDRAARDLCIYNLGRIDSAKSAWALENGGNTSIEPDPEDLKRFFTRETMPACPAGGEYEIGLLNETPFCTFDNLGHIYLPDTHPDATSPANGSDGVTGGPPPWSGSPGGNGKR